MRRSDLKELKADTILTYKSWMQGVYYKWGKTVDPNELRLEVNRILIDHAVGRIRDDYRKTRRPARRVNRLIKTLEADLASRGCPTQGAQGGQGQSPANQEATL